MASSWPARSRVFWMSRTEFDCAILRPVRIAFFRGWAQDLRLSERLLGLAVQAHFVVDKSEIAQRVGIGRIHAQGLPIRRGCFFPLSKAGQLKSESDIFGGTGRFQHAH